MGKFHLLAVLPVQELKSSMGTAKCLAKDFLRACSTKAESAGCCPHHGYDPDLKDKTNTKEGRQRVFDFGGFYGTVLHTYKAVASKATGSPATCPLCDAGFGITLGRATGRWSPGSLSLNLALNTFCLSFRLGKWPV